MSVSQLSDIALNDRLAVADKNGHICIVDTLTRTIVFDSTILIASEDDQGDVTLTPIDSNVNTLKFVRSHPASTGESSLSISHIQNISANTFYHRAQTKYLLCSC
jgi:hypothetical protein